MSLKMTPSDIAFAAQVVASLKTHVHRVTVAGLQGGFGQHYYISGQSSEVNPHTDEDRDFFFKQWCPQNFPALSTDLDDLF